MSNFDQKCLSLDQGKSCSFSLPRMPFINCCQFMYLVISLLVLRAGCGIWLCQFLIIAYLFTLSSPYLVTWLMDLYQTDINTALGWDNQVKRVLWPWPHFQLMDSFLINQLMDSYQTNMDISLGYGWRDIVFLWKHCFNYNFAAFDKSLYLKLQFLMR